MIRRYYFKRNILASGNDFLLPFVCMHNFFVCLMNRENKIVRFYFIFGVGAI